MKQWVIITGAGTGIGSALTKELCKLNYFNILAVGRRSKKLDETKFQACNPKSVFTLPVDISTAEGINKICEAIPKDEYVKCLVQNAAVGVPDILTNIKKEDFDYAMAVNVTAPLMLTQKLLPKLKACEGRILHLGTGVAFNAQLGTTTYGVTKMAFHRLYQQLQVELFGTGVSIANLLPGVVDTEGLWEHYNLAKEQQLPHVAYFDKVKEENNISTAETAAKFIKFVLLDTKSEEYSKEWNIHDMAHWPRWK